MGDYEAGLAVRKAVLGDEYVARSLREADEFTAPFQQLVTEYCWGDIWTRDDLPRRTRSLINIAMLTALNRPDELRLHVRGACRNGCTRDEIRGVLLQAAVYCGVPGALISSPAVTASETDLPPRLIWLSVSLLVVPVCDREGSHALRSDGDRLQPGGLAALMAGDYDRPPDIPDYVNMENTLSMGELVEPLGFDSIWATEHYGSAYSMQPNPLQWLAYWAGRTTRVDVGTAVIVAPWWNPVRLASEISMLDVLLRGRRLHLGIGRGVAPHEYASLGIPIEESHTYFYDVVNAIRAADGAERFTFDGQVFKIPPTTIRPQARHKGDLTTNIKAAFSTEKSARLAAENGLGPDVRGRRRSRRHDRRRSSRFNQIRAELGLPPDQPTTLLWMYCAETSGRGRGRVGVLPQPAAGRPAPLLRVEQSRVRGHQGLRGVRAASDRRRRAGRRHRWPLAGTPSPSAPRTRSSTGSRRCSGRSASRRS